MAAARGEPWRSDDIDNESGNACPNGSWHDQFYQTKFSCDTLNDSELTRPGAPSLNPRLRITNCEQHQMVVHQIVPIIVGTRPVPTTEHCVNIGRAVERKLPHPNSLVIPDNVPILEIVVVAIRALPTVRMNPIADSL